MDVQASGSLVVEMLDAGTGKALAGHTAQDCVPIMGNFVDVRTPSRPRPQPPPADPTSLDGLLTASWRLCAQVAVQWQGSGGASSLLSGLAGQSVQLKLLMKGDVDLFSYAFAAADE